MLILEREGELHLVNRVNGLEDDFIHDLMADYEGNLWLGTEIGAVKVGSHDAVIFDGTEELPSPWAWSIMEPGDGSIWITTDARSGHLPGMGMFQRGTSAADSARCRGQPCPSSFGRYDLVWAGRLRPAAHRHGW